MGMTIPFILITGTISEEFAVNILKQGASDYLLKNHMQRLPEAIIQAIQKAKDEKRKKELYQETLKNEHRFRAMVENMATGVFLINRSGMLIYQNPASYRISGSSNNAKDRNIFQLVHPDDFTDVMKFYSELSEQPGLSAEIEYRILYHEEKYIGIRAHVSNMLHDEYVKAIMVQYMELAVRA
jgi:PAS domain S-box-containing protein